MTALLSMLTWLLGCSSQPEPQPPNVLVIAVDTLRADHLGAYGYPLPTSPRIDALLRTSVQFDRAHAPAPWTLPSFAGLLTGLPASTTGCWQFSDRLPEAATTLPEVLVEHGYQTGGVVGHVFLGANHGLAQGYQQYDEDLVQDTLAASHLAVTSQDITARAITMVDGFDRNKPFFLFAHYFDPHNAYKRHPGLTETFGRGVKARYDGEIAYTDQHVGSLLDQLDQRGLLANTVIVFVADHGEEFRDHGGMRHGKTLFAEVVRVPLAIRVPGVPPTHVQTPVSTLDVMPTILDLAGLPTPPHLMGRSLRASLRGPEPTRDILLESRLNLRKVAVLEGLIHGDHKLIVEYPRLPDGQPDRDADTVRRRLYRWKSDPRDQHDLSASEPGVVSALYRRLRKLVDSAQKRGATFEATPVQASDDELERLRMLGYVEDEHAP